VVFTLSSLAIAREGATVEVPAAVGSTLSPDTLSSDDPSVVMVTPAGGLHGLKAGRTTIRSVANPGQVLEVEVLGDRELVLIPNPLTLQPSGEGELALLDKRRGGLDDPGVPQWYSSAPDVATVFGGRVKAGALQGSSTITAVIGGRAIQATVVVKRATPRNRPSP
jgi:hypothetical protein